MIIYPKIKQLKNIITISLALDPTLTLEAEYEWQLPFLPQLPSVFRETPSPPLKLNLNGTIPQLNF